MTASVCSTPGCPQFAVRRGQCAAHARASQSAYDASRGGRQARGYGRGWEKARLAVPERDSWTCQIRGPRCTVRATTVDHIVPTIRGGAHLDERNLRAACGPCNYGRRPDSGPGASA